METNNSSSWKTKWLIGGVLMGALAGLGTAYLLIRTTEEAADGPPEINTMDMLKAGMNIIGLVRGIAALGNRK
jgi:hypothetical protein